MNIPAQTEVMKEQSWRALQEPHYLEELIGIVMAKEPWELSLEQWAFAKKVLALVAATCSKAALDALEGKP